IYSSEWTSRTLGNSFENVGHDPTGSLEPIERAFYLGLSSLRAAEERSGTTLVGPHRDEWFFEFGGQRLKGHGSQGEVRSALLALKLAETELFRERVGARP